MTDELIDALAAQVGGEEQGEQLPDWHHGLKLDMSWEPRLNPTQRKMYYCQSPYILADAERGTGKTTAAIHKLVRHCVRNKNALGFIVVREIGIATEGGAWSKLLMEVLPQWRHGNFDRKTNKRLDRGCGIEFTPSKLDSSDKKPFVMISNRHGSFSQIKLLSLYVDGHLYDKLRGKEPSAVLVDEAQTMESDMIFQQLSMQVGRRQDIDDVQQLIFCANPKGPSHWLYRLWWYHEKDADGNDIESPFDEETGHPIKVSTDEPITKYARFHVPIQENLHNLPAGYWERVIEATKSDPIEHQRMVLGEWVDKPEGAALFKDVWSDQLHLRGDALKSRGIMPVPGHLFLIGWDPGAAHTSISMLQFIPTVKQIHWMLFDEMNYVGKYMPYRQLVPKLIERLIYWEYAASEHYERKIEFNFRHISDDSAFNQFRAKEGSFDAQDIEDISKEYVLQKWPGDSVEEKRQRERFTIRMRACPKGPHSVEARVRLATDVLHENALVVSATCVRHREMFMNLEQDKDNRMKPKRSKYLHPFDSATYPILYYSSGSGRPATKIKTLEVKPEFYRVGR